MKSLFQRLFKNENSPARPLESFGTSTLEPQKMTKVKGGGNGDSSLVLIPPPPPIIVTDTLSDP